MTGDTNILEGMNIMEAIKLLAPLILIQFGFAAFCIVDIIRNGVRNLNKIAWIAIALFVNILGPIIYLVIGRKRF